MLQEIVVCYPLRIKKLAVESGVGVTVITLKPESHPENRVEKTRQLINQHMGIAFERNV